MPDSARKAGVVGDEYVLYGYDGWRSLLDDVLLLVLALLQDRLWVEGVVVLLVLVPVPHVQSAALPITRHNGPTRPYQTLQAHTSLRDHFGVLAHRLKRFLHSVGLQGPLLTVQSDTLKLGLSRIDFILVLHPLLLLLGLQSFWL